jgi:hypothetical protein
VVGIIKKQTKKKRKIFDSVVRQFLLISEKEIDTKKTYKALYGAKEL